MNEPGPNLENPIVAPPANGAIEVTLLHRVETVPADAPWVDRAGAVTANRLERYLQARADWPRPPAQALWRAGPSLGGCVVSFDDGYRSVLTTALPLLERYGVHALVFVTVGFADGTHQPYEHRLADLIEQVDRLSLPDGQQVELDGREARDRLWGRLREPLKPTHAAARLRAVEQLEALNGGPATPLSRDGFMGWDEIRELDRHPLVTIGSHSLSHPRLDALPWRSGWREIVGARRRLERQLGHSVEAMAYPYGAFGRRGPWLARLSGHRAAFTTQPRSCQPGTDSRWRLPRWPIEAKVP